MNQTQEVILALVVGNGGGGRRRPLSQVNFDLDDKDKIAQEINMDYADKDKEQEIYKIL